MGLNEGGSSGITIVMPLLLWVIPTSGVSVALTESEGCVEDPQDEINRLKIAINVNIDKDRCLNNIGPPILNFYQHTRIIAWIARDVKVLV
jgi:hypothetical protein